MGGRPLTGTATRTIAAPPEAVWDLVTDVTRYGEWSPECTGGEWVDGPRGAGSVFRGHNRLGPFRWTTTCTVEEWDPPTSFGYVARFALLRAATRWRFRIEPVPEGCRVTQAFESVGTPRVMTGLERLLRRDRQVVAGMQHTLARLAEAAEQA